MSNLQDRLDEFKNAFESGALPYNAHREVIELMHRATAELKVSGIEVLRALPYLIRITYGWPRPTFGEKDRSRQRYRQDSHRQVNSSSISGWAKTLSPDLIRTVAGGDKKARSTFNERCGAANVTSRNKVWRPGGVREQSSVNTAGWSRPVIRGSSCIRVCKTNRMVAFRQRLKFLAVKN